MNDESAKWCVKVAVMKHFLALAGAGHADVGCYYTHW